MTAAPMIIDVDTGIDDAFGLLYALGQTAVQLIGVSTVAGNVSLAKATRNTRAVLSLCGRADIPVWPGCASPLLKAAEDASEIHGETGLGYAMLPEPPEPAELPEHAVDEILAAAQAYQGELILVATGPLTNIAAALIRSPQLTRQVKRFVLMGGAFKEPGNVTATAEFNIWHDPEAARIVFRAFGAEGSAPLIAIGLDVTRRTLLTPAHLETLARRLSSLPRGPALADFLAGASRHYFELMAKWGRPQALVMHDPLAVAVAVDPSYVKSVRAFVDVETAGELTRGMTVADLRPNPGAAANADVALEVEADRFLADYLNAVVRLGLG
jgi:purine nucleosidase